MSPKSVDLDQVLIVYLLCLPYAAHLDFYTLGLREDCSTCM